MTLFTRIIVCLVFVVISNCAHSKSEQTFNSKLSKASESIYALALHKTDEHNNSLYGFLGTSFQVSKNELVTAGHICLNLQNIEDTEGLSVRAVNSNGVDFKVVDIEFLYMSGLIDMCLITIGEYFPTRPLVLNNNKDYKKVDEVFIISAGAFNIPVITEGRIISPKTNGYLTISANVVSGFSGSPVLNKRLEVISMVTEASENFPITFSRPISEIKSWLDFNKVSYHDSPKNQE